MSEIPVIWATCSCYVWPVVPLNRIGRCGRCGEQAHVLEDVATRREAVEIFTALNGEGPTPIRHP